MAKKRRQSARRSGGGTLFGILIGLILGLIAAVAVALFVTRAPMPFADKFSREPAQTLLPDVRDAPDPNIGLRGSRQSALPADTAPQVPQPDKPTAEEGKELDKLIANLTQTAEPAEPKQESAAKPSERPAAASDTTTSYYLQAGAFRSASDAESVRARILMLGLPAEIQQTQIDGSTINRVRVGPFTGIDAMNQARSQLGDEKIESSVVRP